LASVGLAVETEIVKIPKGKGEAVLLE